MTTFSGSSEGITAANRRDVQFLTDVGEKQVLTLSLSVLLSR
jgi:hypothetical protein